MIIASGKRTPILSQTDITYDPQRGVQLVERWEVVGNNLWGVASSYQAAGVAYNFTPGRAKSVLVATSGGGMGNPLAPDVEIDTWELLANEIQKDLFEGALSLGSDVIAAMRRGLKQELDAADVLLADGVTHLSAGAQKIYNLYQRGHSAYATSQYVLRHTTNVSNRYGENVADTNVERIYTTAQLKTEITNAASWVYPCPGRLVYKLENIPAPGAVTDYLWGWRKLASQETTAANNRINITTEYWLEHWSTIIYLTVP